MANLHSHTSYSDGRKLPSDAFAYAREDCKDYDPDDLTPTDEFRIKVDNWLHENGVEEEGETVLIRCWW